MNDQTNKTLIKITSVIVLCFFALSANIAVAINAAPYSFSEAQPDGSTITLFPRGDEHYNWTEDSNGYTVLKVNGRYEYAMRGSSGRLNSTGLVVGRDNPKANGLQKRTLPSAAVRAESAKVNGAGSSGGGSTEGAERVAPVGGVKNLVVMIRFSDHVGRTLPSAADIGVLFNAVGGDPVLAPTGSVKDVYFENSYGQLTLNSEINPGVNDWITVSNTEAYYANGQSGDSTLWGALKEALTILDSTVNFSDYDSDNDGQIDSIAFIHSGYGAEWGGTDSYGASSANRIWSHRWTIQQGGWRSKERVKVTDYHISPGVWGTSGSDIGRIGVIAHETGHFFGLPDLYDTNGGGSGIGSWGLMANSWDFDGTQYCPPHFSPWSKVDLGWYTPTVISASGEYLINQAESNAEVYRIDNGFSSSEYLMIENRQNAGFDCTVPQGGLVIWHIDDTAGFNTEGHPGQSGFPGNGNHYRVAVVQADGNFDLERDNNRGDVGDVFRAGGVDTLGAGPSHPNTDTYKNGIVATSGNEITNISASGASMTFCLNGCGNPVAPDAPSGLAAAASSDTQIDLSWADNSNNETGFRVERSDDGLGGWVVVSSAGANVTSHSDTGLAFSTEYFYRLIAFNSIGDSTYSNVASATTDDEPIAGAIALSANGFKVKGKHQVDLSWSGSTANNIDIYRDSILIATTSNSGAYNDNIGAKGGATYQYEICDTGTSNCSNTAVVVF